MSCISIEIDENTSQAADQMDFEARNAQNDVDQVSDDEQVGVDDQVCEDDQICGEDQVCEDGQVGVAAKEHVMNKTLLQMVLSKKQVHLSLAKRWVEFYLESPTAALVSLLQFVVEASGSQYRIPEDTSMPFVYSDILTHSSLYFPNTCIYPLIRKPADVFVHQVDTFLKALLLVANEIPADKYNIFLTEMTSFVLACSESSTRTFRHTGTMIGLKIMTILSDLKSLDDETVKSLWMWMFKSMFEVRRQDIVNDIRLLCLSELGQWFSRYPHCYLQPSCLRIFYESLNDASGEVRQCSLDNISILGRKDELLPQRVALATEFREILLELCVAKEDEISEKSLRLLTDFYQLAPEILSGGAGQLLEQLIMAANRGLAQAAADLFILRRNGLDGESFSQRIIHLLQFFVDSEHEQADYFVDSLFDNCEMILDWEPMIAVLMENPRCHQQSDIYCSSLIAILLAGVKQATTGEIPPGRYTKDLKREPKKGAQKRATMLLAPVLPELLRTYANRLGDIERLLELPKYFCFDYYRAGNKMGQLLRLFDQFDTILFDQTSITLLQTGAETLEFMNRMVPNSHTKSFLNSAITNYKMAWQRMLVPNSAQSPQNLSTRLLVSLRLLTVLSGHFNLTEWQLTEPLLVSLKRLVRERRMPDGDDLPPEALSLYLKASFCCLVWNMEHLKDTSFNNLSMDEYCADLRQNLEDYLFVTFSLVGNGNIEPLAYPSFAYTCDLFVLFGNLCGSSNPSIRSVAHVPSGTEVDILEGFLMDNLLELSPSDLMKEANREELQRIRSILTSYLKLVCLGVMPSMRASKIYKYYVKYHAPFGDIMRCSMELALQMNPVHFAMTLLHTCLLLFVNIFADGNPAGQLTLRSAEFSELIELAHRLAKLLISNPMGYRECVIVFHRSGIMFVFEAIQKKPTVVSKKLPFLRVLKVFVPLLLVQDKIGILTYFEHFEQVVIPTCSTTDMKYLKDYRTALSPRKTNRYSQAT